MKHQIKPWKKLSSEVIVNHKRLTATVDEVELPNGKTKAYFRYAPARHHSVIIVALDGRKRVLIQKEYSYPPNKIMWQLPGGSMLDNEDVTTAARRELAEESGYGARHVIKLGAYYTNNRLSDQKQFVVLCTGLYEHKLTADDDEFIENHWLTKKDIITMIAEGQFDNINLLAALNLWFQTK